MNKNEIKAQLNNLINCRNNYWTAFLVTSGGTMALFFNADNLIKIIFVLIGALLSIILFILHIDLNKNINKLINTLNEEAKNDKL